MLVVLDSNVWISEWGLSTAIGSAIRFFIQQQGATLVIPEVVRLETEENLKANLLNHVASIQKNHSQLLSVFGSLKEVVLPTEEQIAEKVVALFEGLDVDTRPIPFSLDAARSSFLKAVRKEAPSDKNQQFKDGVLWAHCVDLLAESDVVLVTSDKALFQGRTYANGLATSLEAEIHDSQNSLRLMQDATSLLADIKSEVPIDDNLPSNSVLEALKETVPQTLSKAGFRISSMRSAEKQLFVTEVATRLACNFVLTYDCIDEQDTEVRTDGSLRIEGDCVLDTADQEFVDIRSHGESLTYTDSEGEQRTGRTVAFAGGITIGHKEVQHTVRYELD